MLRSNQRLQTPQGASRAVRELILRGLAFRDYKTDVALRLALIRAIFTQPGP